MAQDRPPYLTAPTLSNCASPVPHAVLSVPVLPDLKTKQSVPRNTAAKSPASTKRRKSDRTGRQNCALTSFLLGVDPSKPPRQPNQRSARETARNISHCPHLPMLPYSPIVNPPPKSKSHQSTKHRRRLTLMGEMHSLCGSKRCGIRIILPRQHVIHVVNRVRITKPHSPPRDPLSTPGIPSERQGRDADDGTGELPSSLEFWGWIVLSALSFVVDCGLDLSKFF